ncbi:tail fiber assembly protein [Pseudomonas veronii]
MNESTLVVYQAHPVTGEYIGPSQADPDPLEEGNWLIPAMAFAEPPPDTEPGFAVAHVPGSDKIWSLVPDFRGTVYRIASGEAVSWGNIGPLPDNLTTKVCPGPYYKWVDGDWKIDNAAEMDAPKYQALAARDALLVEATMRIAPLQDAVDLGDASPEEQVELEDWKRYRISLNRIQLQPGFPKSIDWPTTPLSQNPQ